MTKKRGPIVIDLDTSDDRPGPDVAPPVPDLSHEVTQQGQAMQALAMIGARRRSWLGRLFWGVLASIVTFALSLWAWDFVTGLVDRSPVLGAIALGLVGLFILILIAITLRELAGFARLRRLDALHAATEEALIADDLPAARHVAERLDALYKSREDMRWARERFAERQGDMFDADSLLRLAETELMSPLDKAARQEIEAAARQVATVTAIVPIALADLFTALAANMRMIRRVAEIYGGRAGTLGSWRLLKTVLTHLVATGAVAVGDDLIGSVAGGGVLSKVSRRFGEGIINGALTARVGVAALEVCRPLPFRQSKRPSVTNLVQRALTGLFGRSKG
ncbi:YcjF family protein [Aliiroseovarius sp. YM-037]|uniref:YcjF family protein n=1 Tax=Aliiroseovarius sp. YM-037 TaxID=3341728 RepID=UPI003A8047C7